VSYPPPPGPQGPPPQNPPAQNPGWQQPTYQPQGGNWAAPPYGTPPPKNRAGLIIVLIVVLVAAILGIIGFVAFRLTSGGSDNGGTAPAGPLTSTAAAPKTAPSRAPTKAVPTKPVPSKPVTSQPAAGTKQAAFALAERFAGQLNGGNTDAAVAMSCADTRTTMPTLISVWIGGPTKLTVNQPVSGQDPYFVRFTGTTKGHQVSGMIIIEGPCVKVFQLAEN
jgi:flagellar basal body-associated protein FliL